MRVAEGVSNQWTGSPLECGTGMWDWNVGLECGTGLSTGTQESIISDLYNY